MIRAVTETEEENDKMEGEKRNWKKKGCGVKKR